MSDMRFAQTIARFVDRPLLVLPRHAMAMWNSLSSRLGTTAGDLPGDGRTRLAKAIDDHFDRARSGELKAGRLLDQDGNQMDSFARVGSTGVLPIVGELVNRGAWIGANSGMVSYEGLKFQLADLAADDSIENVVLDIDSPGGEAVGFDSAAASVRELAAVKPVYAVVNGMAASAAYALASGASRIIVPKTGIVGSIGVVMLHLDMSEGMAAAGVKPTLIFAGEHKVDANPFEPLPEAVRDNLQAEVFAIYDAFIETVAAGRAGKTSAEAARATEARTFIGADAVAAGIADEIGTFEEVLAVLSAEGQNIRRDAVPDQKLTQAKKSDEALLKAEAPAEPELPDEIAPEEATEATDLIDEGDSGLDASAADEGLAGNLKAILADERSEGRERFCVALACESPDMAPDRVLELAVLGTKAGAPAGPSVAARAAANGAAEIKSEPKVAATVAAGWARVTNAVNDKVRGS